MNFALITVHGLYLWSFISKTDLVYIRQQLGRLEKKQITSSLWVSLALSFLSSLWDPLPPSFSSPSLSLSPSFSSPSLPLPLSLFLLSLPPSPSLPLSPLPLFPSLSLSPLVSWHAAATSARPQYSSLLSRGALLVDRYTWGRGPERITQHSATMGHCITWYIAPLSQYLCRNSATTGWQRNELHTMDRIG